MKKVDISINGYVRPPRRNDKDDAPPLKKDKKQKTKTQEKLPVPSVSKLDLRRRRARWYVMIRHACDEPDHTETKYKHDPGLCNNSQHNKEDIIKVVKELCAHCGGEPEQIYTSPLERCFLTAKRMRKCLKEKPPVILEPNMSRYFSPSEQERPEISKKSMHRGVLITESRKEFESRIEKHLTKMEKSPIRIIWCITHALVMKRADNLNQEKKPFDHINPLQYRIWERARK